MSFRDDFFGRTTQSELERTVDRTFGPSLYSNRERLLIFRDEVQSTFEQGIGKITDSQTRNAHQLQAELSYCASEIAERAEALAQAIADVGEEIVGAIEDSTTRISDSIDDAADRVVHAIQNLSSYLGSRLLDVRWAVERHTAVSRRSLQTLLQSLSNESRQYYEQGVRCFEMGEMSLAKTTFHKALESNVTNHFAYQYLGFIAVEEGHANEAKRNFDLAKKFSIDKRHTAMALSHLARCYDAEGDHQRASSIGLEVVNIAPEAANYHYDAAIYCARASQVTTCIGELRAAIEKDWAFFAAAIIEPAFSPFRELVLDLLEQMRNEQRIVSEKALRLLDDAIQLAIKNGTLKDAWIASRNSLRQDHASGHVYDLRNVTKESVDEIRTITRESQHTLNGRLQTAAALHEAKTRAIQQKAAGERQTLAQQLPNSEPGDVVFALQAGAGCFTFFWGFSVGVPTIALSLGWDKDITFEAARVLVSLVGAILFAFVSVVLVTMASSWIRSEATDSVNAGIAAAERKARSEISDLVAEYSAMEGELRREMAAFDNLEKQTTPELHLS